MSLSGLHLGDVAWVIVVATAGISMWRGVDVVSGPVVLFSLCLHKVAAGGWCMHDDSVCDVYVLPRLG